MIRVRCDKCDRRGAYRADRLLALVGDVAGPEALCEIAKMGKCQRAINSPAVTDFNYNEKRCQIRIDAVSEALPPTIGMAMHQRWRGFIRCERHHQGLKSAKPCGVEAELDMPTLVAALGFALEVGKLNAILSAPCCGSRTFELTWYQPTGQVGPVFPKR